MKDEIARNQNLYNNTKDEQNQIKLSRTEMKYDKKQRRQRHHAQAGERKGWENVERSLRCLRPPWINTRRTMGKRTCMKIIIDVV